MKIKCTTSLILSIPALLGELVACAPNVQQAVLPDPYDNRIDIEKFRHKIVNVYTDCSTANNTPVGACSDWVTGSDPRYH